MSVRNQIRNGYKMTKAGRIPTDWDTTRLEKIARIERGKFSARPQMIRAITVDNIHSCKLATLLVRLALSVHILKL